MEEMTELRRDIAWLWYLIGPNQLKRYNVWTRHLYVLDSEVI